jgi:hypothetical protein
LEIPVSLAPALSGRELFAQLVVASTEECTTGKRWAASHALSIRVR